MEMKKNGKVSTMAGVFFVLCLSAQTLAVKKDAQPKQPHLMKVQAGNVTVLADPTYTVSRVQRYIKESPFKKKRSPLSASQEIVSSYTAELLNGRITHQEQVRLFDVIQYPTKVDELEIIHKYRVTKGPRKNNFINLVTVYNSNVRGYVLFLF